LPSPSVVCREESVAHLHGLGVCPIRGGLFDRAAEARRESHSSPILWPKR